MLFKPVTMSGELNIEFVSYEICFDYDLIKSLDLITEKEKVELLRLKKKYE